MLAGPTQVEQSGDWWFWCFKEIILQVDEFKDDKELYTNLGKALVVSKITLAMLETFSKVMRSEHSQDFCTALGDKKKEIQDQFEVLVLDDLRQRARRIGERYSSRLSDKALVQGAVSAEDPLLNDIASCLRTYNEYGKQLYAAFGGSVSINLLDVPDLDEGFKRGVRAYKDKLIELKLLHEDAK